MKEQVKIYIDECTRLNIIEGSLQKTMNLLSNYLNDIPEEYRETSQIRFRKNYEWESDDDVFDIYYLRPETDEEESLRLEQEKERAEQKRQEDLKLLERLKREYEQ